LSLMGCANGDELKCLTMIDEFTKESLCIDVAGSIRSKRLIQVLEQLIKERGRPMVLKSDLGYSLSASPYCNGLLIAGCVTF
jgi:hypothetical protein